MQLKNIEIAIKSLIKTNLDLKQHYEKKGLKEPKVRAEVYVTLNGRPSRLYFDPQLDLTRLHDGWRHKYWLYE